MLLNCYEKVYLCIQLGALGFFIHFFYDSPNNLLVWDLKKTPRRTSNNEKFDMKTMVFQKNVLSKKNEENLIIPIKAYQIFVALSL
jgi:hypothetical protein